MEIWGPPGDQPGVRSQQQGEVTDTADIPEELGVKGSQVHILSSRQEGGPPTIPPLAIMR